MLTTNKNLTITKADLVTEFKDRLIVEKLHKLKHLLIASVYDAYGIPTLDEHNEYNQKYVNEDALYDKETKTSLFSTDDDILYGIVKYDKFNVGQDMETTNTTSIFTPFKEPDGNFDVQLAIQAMSSPSLVTPKSRGKCAFAVRSFMEAGGIDTNGRPVSAYLYVNFLPQKGFKHIAELKGRSEQNIFFPQPGDIAVMEHGKHGHICMFNGNQWVSDFPQRNMWPYKGEGICNIFRFQKA